jgi:hypothetical protein
MTFWPTATVALAGMNWSTAICGRDGSLTPAWMVMGWLSMEPAAFDWAVPSSSSDEPQAAPATSIAAATVASTARRRRNTVAAI